MGKKIRDISEPIALRKFVNGGQALGECADGTPCFVWGGLPGERVKIRQTKRKARAIEGVVTEVLEPSPERIAAKEPESFLSTSPWQILDFQAEQRWKQQLIDDAFWHEGIKLSPSAPLFSDDIQYEYRNKIEFSWYGDASGDGSETLDLAFFKRGSKGKIVVEGTELAHMEINQVARAVRDVLRTFGVSARQLKTLLVRSNMRGEALWQLYVKDKLIDAQKLMSATTKAQPSCVKGAAIIFSDPKSPASKVTKIMAETGETTLQDALLGINFSYVCEGFFQINVPVYECVLSDIQHWTKDAAWVIDMYAGVGTIGLTVGKNAYTTLVEINEAAVQEMRRNIAILGRQERAEAVLAPSERALEYITDRQEIVILDPPRAGLHRDVITRLLEIKPRRIIYLSCNPTTQARDVQMLLGDYASVFSRGYNFFPRTPHIEHLIIIDRI